VSIPTTPLKFPIQAKPVDEQGNWTPTWLQSLQRLYDRVGADVAPSNLQLANAIGLQVTGPAAAIANDIAVFDGITGKLIKDGGKKVTDLAPLASPAFSGTPTAPTAGTGTSTTQLATTAFVAASVVGFGNVSGPVSSVDSDLALFNGITGKLIKDSGVQLSAIALLASPTFTGIPAAPTPTAGTNTTQIATTAFVTGAVSTAGGVSGPASSVDSDIALFNGITGKIIKDSGVLLSSLAPLASPALSGIPTAPTAAPGTATTQMATTAFVAAAFGSTASFSAHNNGTAQSIPNNAFTVLVFGTKTYDIGTKFVSNAWTPPAGKLVMLAGEVAIGLIINTIASLSVFKNGVEFKRGDQVVASTTETPAMSVNCMDIPNGTDVYDLRVFQNTGVAQNTASTSYVTWFQGTTVTA
jgi:hypothetical protein